MSDNFGLKKFSIIQRCKSGFSSIAFAFFVTVVGVSFGWEDSSFAQEAPAAEPAPGQGRRPGAERGRRGEGPRGDRPRGKRRRGRRGGEQAGGAREAAQEKSDQKKETTEESTAESKSKKKATRKKITPALPQEVADQVKWRSIGPANMGGRITALTIYEKEPSNWWAATASGGLLKTENNGVTFEHQFDDQATVSIGDVQVAQSDKNIVWVGTGESNPRNSVSWGDGVYKSTDGGKTWKNMGLKKTFQTGALAIHPENPDVVYVGSLGRLWGPNKERGLFMTEDGGENWKKVLYINDVTGVIDVQINPKNFDEILVATYERKRDGFDGNDPEKRFGAGSGIYKSVDGGKSFRRLSKGLPTCKLGRIGLDYFEADPNFIFAVVESEKIAESREDLPYAGLNGANADVGATITRVVDDGPSDKAGLKVDDIVIQVDEKIVTDYNSMLSEMRKKSAGDVSKLRVYREGKLTEIDVEFEEYPEGRTQRSPFTGTLGGQAANKQDEQGEDGFQFGGVYMSEDGGDSWTRINSLNPRPMYYSNIQVDPVDRNNIYLCGTSLYKSSDGGETFTGDGHDRTVHVDHHALWINKSNPKHIILGNDGGLYVTYDRMENWDHHNHIAIGQFYHASVDANQDYKVYGGLQDNGSWAGPVRAPDGSGPINSDWIRVGGGDGFVTLTDPNDPEQVYFESQNGGMGRVHLGTGERGFISPRPNLGEPRYRFNWKTPFILSPHNSQIHYSAGNFVFRSFKKGDGAKAFSPEIVNSDRGAASALTESGAQPGVLYVGTTDGALWMTQDGGQIWEPLFAEPQIAITKEDDKKDDDKKGDDKKETTEKAAASKGADAKSKKADASAEDPESEEAGDDVANLTGVWNGNVEIEGVGPVEFSLELVDKDGKLTGSTTSSAGDLDIESGKFDPDSNKVEFVASTDELTLVCTAEADGDQMVGTFEMNGEMTIDFEAERDPASKSKKKKPVAKEGANKARAKAKAEPKAETKPTASESGEESESSEVDSVSGMDDPVSGTWVGELSSPRGNQEITVTLKRESDTNITGTFESPRGEREIGQGFFEPETGTLTLMIDGGRITMDLAGKVSGDNYAGEATINDQFEMGFSLKRSDKQEGTEGDEKEGGDEGEEAVRESKGEGEGKAEVSGKSKQEKDAETKNADEKKDVESKDEDDEKSDDPVTGTWVGEMVSPRGSQELTIVLKRETDKKITGTMVTQRGDREIGRGIYDPDKKSLTLVAESEQFTIEFGGELKGETYSGEANVMDRFQMEFSVERESKEAPETEEEEEAEPRVSTSNLGELLPGPRWVSSLEASKFEANHCYVTFDGHRSDDDGVYVFKTEDFGKTWKSIQANIPDTAGSARVIREDVVNKNLLFLGCEFSSWYSIDAGESWTQIKGEFPTVSVHEFAIHPTGNDVVAGTHGRSLWVADISWLRQVKKEVFDESSTLMKPAEVTLYPRSVQRGKRATREFVGASPESGTSIVYSLGQNSRFVRLTIEDLRGDVVKSFETSTRKGIHVLNWDLSSDTGQGGRGRGGRGGQRRISEGVYLVKLRVGDETHMQELVVKAAGQ